MKTKLYMTQQPYASSMMIAGAWQDVYLAAVENEDGDDAGTVYWYVVRPDAEDESEACNWSDWEIFWSDVNAADVELIGPNGEEY